MSDARERLAAALAAVGDEEWKLVGVGDEIDISVYLDMGDDVVDIENTIALAKAEFIVAAHNDLGELLAECERLTARVKLLETTMREAMSAAVHIETASSVDLSDKVWTILANPFFGEDNIS